MKARFCPGYHVARTCDARCDACAHVIVREMPPWWAPSGPPGGRLPVAGYGRVEELKIVVHDERRSGDAN